MRSLPRGLLGLGWPPWLVLVGSLLLTTVATALMTMSYRDRDAARFENAVQSATDRIVERLEVYISSLRGTAAMMSTFDDVSADEFRLYVEHLELDRRYPGVQGIGWSARLDRDAERDIDERHEILYLEPLDARNRAALGFDMYSEATRRTAMRRARDQGGPAMSGRVTLVQEIVGPAQPGFLIYVPVFAGGSVPPTVAGRRDQLVGYAYSPFRAGDLFTGTFGSEEQPRVTFAVYDGTDPGPERLLHASPRPAGHDARHTATRRMIIAGRPWTVRFESLPTFEAASLRLFIAPFAAAGLLLSFVLFGFVASLSRSRFVAEEASRAKSAFLATMSHELRTPLNAILGHADLLDAGIPEPLPERSIAQIHRIREGARHLLNIIEGILTFSRIEARSEPLSIDEIRVPALIESVVDMVRPLAEGKGIALHVDLEHAPPTAETDEHRLKQILLNLLGNAIKFTEEGEVEVIASGGDGALHVSVRDTGVGIDPAHQEDIFDPFWQVDQSHTRTVGGTGLGLTVSRGLARMLGGDLGVTSEPGRGSTFHLTVATRHDPGSATA